MQENSNAMKLLRLLPFDEDAMQHIIDVDKYLNSEKCSEDLCGKYMPCCEHCNKCLKNPCVKAYKLSRSYNQILPLLGELKITQPAVIQSITDVDKYLRSESAGCDLCGRYCSFCAYCDKSEANPCANAYLRYIAAQGGEVECESAVSEYDDCQQLTVFDGDASAAADEMAAEIVEYTEETLSSANESSVESAQAAEANHTEECAEAQEVINEEFAEATKEVACDYIKSGENESAAAVSEPENKENVSALPSNKKGIRIGVIRRKKL